MLGQKKIIGREFYLELLRKHYNENKHICLLGSRFIGKTTIVKQFLSEHKGIYVDFEKFGMSPEQFCLSFIGRIAYAETGKYVDDIESLLKIKEKLSASIIDEVALELSKLKPDQRKLVKLAFMLSEEMGKKRLVCIDEFWRIKEMDNYSQIKDVVSLLKEILPELSHTILILTGSASYLSKQICAELDIEYNEVNGISKEKIWLKNKKLAYELTRGNPFYLSCLTKDVKKSFTSQLLDEDGKIHLACKLILEENLSRARGSSLLRSVLKVLSKQHSLRLNEVAKKIYRSGSVTKSLLSRLMEVDLVVKKGNEFSFKEEVLRLYVKHVWHYDSEVEL